jgi:hypothetical protein
LYSKKLHFGELFESFDGVVQSSLDGTDRAPKRFRDLVVRKLFDESEYDDIALWRGKSRDLRPHTLPPFTLHSGRLWIGILFGPAVLKIRSNSTFQSAKGSIMPRFQMKENPDQPCRSLAASIE